MPTPVDFVSGTRLALDFIPAGCTTYVVIAWPGSPYKGLANATPRPNAVGLWPHLVIQPKKIINDDTACSTLISGSPGFYGRPPDNTMPRSLYRDNSSTEVWIDPNPLSTQFDYELFISGGAPPPVRCIYQVRYEVFKGVRYLGHDHTLSYNNAGTATGQIPVPNWAWAVTFNRRELIRFRGSFGATIAGSPTDIDFSAGTRQYPLGPFGNGNGTWEPQTLTPAGQTRLVSFHIGGL